MNLLQRSLKAVQSQLIQSIQNKGFMKNGFTLRKWKLKELKD